MWCVTIDKMCLLKGIAQTDNLETNEMCNFLKIPLANIFNTMQGVYDHNGYHVYIF